MADEFHKVFCRMLDKYSLNTLKTTGKRPYHSYIINDSVDELHITLPERQEEKVETIKFYFTTADMQGGWSITCANDLHPVKFSKGFVIDGRKSYELDITFNGAVYLVSIIEFAAI